MARRKKKEVSLRSVTIYCGYIDKDVTLKPEDVFFEGWQSECELCGGHGGVNISFQCECGDNHYIDLNEW